MTHDLSIFRNQFNRFQTPKQHRMFDICTGKLYVISFSTFNKIDSSLEVLHVHQSKAFVDEIKTDFFPRIVPYVPQTIIYNFRN